MNKNNSTRDILKELSKKAEEIRAQRIKETEDVKEKRRWRRKSVNWILLHEVYEVGEAIEFKTFEQWKQEGATVRRNQKAFVIWGQLVEGDEYSFYPLVYLFSNLQVYKPQEKEEKTHEEPENDDFETVNGDDL